MMILFPFGGTFSVIVVSLLLMLQDIWLGLKVLVAAFVILRIIDNVIAPRILGEITGLNPVWIFISLLAGVRMGGVLGLLLAVPVASFIKNLSDNWRAKQAAPALPSSAGMAQPSLPSTENQS